MENIQQILKDETPFDVNFLLDGKDILSHETDDDCVSLCQKISSKVSKFPLTPRINLEDFEFSANDLLGAGTYSKIYKVVKKDTKKEYAMKVMKKNVYVDYAFTERAILLTGDSHSVTRAHFAFQTPLYIFFILDRMICNLADFLNCIPVKLFLYYTRRIAQCLKTLHDCGYCHGDLKPANILVTPTFDVKLCDFGSSIPCLEGEVFEVPFGGTLWYAAPECFRVSNERGILSRATDWYSFGIIMFEMYIPKHQQFFNGLDEEDVKIQVKNPSYIENRVNDLKNKAVRSFVKQLLTFDYTNRPSFFDLALPDNLSTVEIDNKTHVEILMQSPLFLNKRQSTATQNEAGLSDFHKITNNELTTISKKLDYSGWYFNVEEGLHLKELQVKHFELLKNSNMAQISSNPELSSGEKSIAVAPIRAIKKKRVAESVPSTSGENSGQSSNGQASVEIQSDLTAIVHSLMKKRGASQCLPSTSGEKSTVRDSPEMPNDEILINGKGKKSKVVMSLEAILFQCALCPKSYTTKGNLVTHTNTAHAGIRPLCEICNKFYSSAWCLRRHQALMNHPMDLPVVDKAPDAN